MRRAQEEAKCGSMAGTVESATLTPYAQLAIRIPRAIDAIRGPIWPKITRSLPWAPTAGVYG